MSQRRIFKFNVVPGINTIAVSEDASIVSWGIQNNEYFVWVNTGYIGPSSRKDMHIQLLPTGSAFNGDYYKVHGSIIDNENGFVWHVAELINHLTIEG